MIQFQFAPISHGLSSSKLHLNDWCLISSLLTTNQLQGDLIELMNGRAYLVDGH